jgi:hypothetical protein
MTRFVLKGVELEYFRLIGEPHDNFNKDGKEWTTNFILNDEHLAVCRENGMAKAYVKTARKVDGVDTEVPPFIKFTKKAHGADGTPKEPITVLDRTAKPWNPAVAIGNGSKADIIVNLNEVGMGPNKGKLKPYISKVVIKEHVPYIPDDGIEYDVVEDDGPSEAFNDSLEDIGKETAAAETDW